MGQIDFRTGVLTGSLGQITGARWKETPYVRTKTRPTNPRTAGQVRVRAIFGALVAFGRRIVIGVLNPWIKPPPRNRSAFNQFITNNRAMLAEAAFSYPLLKIGNGSLPGANITAAVRDNAANTVDVSWPTTVAGGAAANDNAIVVIINVTKNVIGSLTSDERDDGSSTVPITVEAGDVLHAYLYFAQGDAANSDTDYSAVA